MQFLWHHDYPPQQNTFVNKKNQVNFYAEENLQVKKVVEMFISNTS